MDNRTEEEMAADALAWKKKWGLSTTPSPHPSYEWEDRDRIEPGPGPTGAFVDTDPIEFLEGLEQLVENNQFNNIRAYLEEYSLEIGAACVGGSLAYMAREDPELTKVIIKEVGGIMKEIVRIPGQVF